MDSHVHYMKKVSMWAVTIKKSIISNSNPNTPRVNTTRLTLQVFSREERETRLPQEAKRTMISCADLFTFSSNFVLIPLINYIDHAESHEGSVSKQMDLHS